MQCIFIKVPVLEFFILITCIFLGFFICIPAYVVELTGSAVRFRAKSHKYF